MSILSAIKQQNSSIDDLAALPQAMIMQMAQRKQINEEMLAPILARKAELADAFARQNALQNAGQVPPTVIEQLMSQNARAEQPQMEEQMPQQMMAQQVPQSLDETGVGQLPIPERQYAGGGIIAFEEGGDVEEDFAYQMALEDQDMNMGSSIDEIFNMAKYGNREKPSENAGVGIRYREPIPAGASKGVEPSESGLARLRAQIMEKESGGRRYDKEGNLLTSSKGALGEMQVMPATARDPGFGIRPARDNSPDELRRVGDEYAAVLLGRYRDPKLAMIAYNMGPGATDRWLASGADPRRLPKETQGYIRGVNLAEGGEVRHFYEGDYIDPFGAPSPSYEMDALRIEEINRARQLKEAQDKNEFLRKSAPQLVDKSVPERAAPKAPPKEEKAQAKPKQEDIDLQTRFNNFVQQQQANPERNIFAEMIARNEKQREENRKSMAEDRNLALLASGLGILGGSSPYASVNIGQGALKGVEFLGGSKARRASELNALSNADLKAMYYGEENKRKERALTSGLAERAIDNLRDYEARLRKSFFIEGIAETPKQREAFENAKRNDPIYRRLLQDASMPAPTQTAPVLNYNPKTRTFG
jgi:hypothetical protein